MAQQVASSALLRAARGAIAFALLGFAAPRVAAAQVAVVVNSANSLEELSIDNLRRLFLGQAKTFPSGAHARVGTYAASAPTFDHAALGLPPEIVRSRWMAMIFRGEATSIPTELATPDDVKQFVREHPDAIAYVPLAHVDATVKVIAIAGHRPTEAGYAIK
jgi:ABC-type phosphate transport system substrate-binding protein